ncbi:hypothetical protein [Pseudomonas kurunegalensis]|uniref:hypothetical protein n=1 Tax=Pseudomonas kurunegalensis TaxID=485880 RepID=UPI003557D124
MDKKLSAVYACLAIGLAMVTAVSVALTIFSLIDDPMLAILFSGAAVFLDVFKYLGWPLAMRLVSQQRILYAGSVLICVVTLGMVSGWSTYDRLMSSIEVSQARQSALAGGRIDNLTSLIKKDSSFIEGLDEAQRKLFMESSELRARGIVTKAQELEASSLSRIDTQRAAAMERMKSNSLEVAEIRSSITKASSIPLLIAAMLCAGFALSLELVPALLLSVLQSQHIKIVHEPALPHDFVSDDSGHMTDNAPSEVDPIAYDPLVTALLKKVSSLPANSKLKVKEFATENKVGNVKSCAAFKIVERLGAIRKTPSGYLTSQITVAAH